VFPVVLGHRETINNAVINSEIEEVVELIEEVPKSTPKQKTKSKPATAKPINKKELYLNNIIKLPTTDYNKNEVNGIIKRLSLVDIKVLKALDQKGAKIFLTNGKITDLPEFSALKEQRVTAFAGGTDVYQGMTRTFEQANGISWGKNAAVRIGYSFIGSTLNLELHELGHLVDTQVFGFVSVTTEFKNIHEAEVSALPKNIGLQSSTEYFAEAISYYFYKSDFLKNNAPRTYSFINNLIKSL